MKDFFEVGNHSLSNHVDEMHCSARVSNFVNFVDHLPILFSVVLSGLYFPVLQPKWWYNFSLPENAEVSACAMKEKK
jgi:hypothetical protein